MRGPAFSTISALLLSAAVPLLLAGFLPAGVVCEDVGSDFAENVAGFRLVELQQERVCRPPTVFPRGVVEPLAPSIPPAVPYKGFTFDTTVVYQRHGTRRSMMGDATSTPFYGKTHPGQLLPQGAYELHVAGIEMRQYLMDAMGLLSEKTGPSESASSSPDDVYNRTLGFDLTEDCRMAGVNPSECSLSELVSALGKKVPTDTVFARSSALPRTQWSGLAFLEGFYGFPFGCAGTVEELERTVGGRTVDVCIRRSACDNSTEQVESTDTSQEVCTSRRLPCVYTTAVAHDGLMSGATVCKEAYADATEYYQSKGVNRKYEAKDPETREALDIAMKIWGAKVLGKDGGWMAGEMAFSEIGAGETRPLAQLAKWVEEQKRLCQDPAASCDPGQVRTYESLLKDMLGAFRDGTHLQYADGKFSRYVVSPAVALQNALFRVKAFGRQEDRKHLQDLLYAIDGFEGLSQDAAVDKLKMLLVSFHDFMLLGLMEMLDIYDGELLPFASRVTFELSHAEAGAGLRGAKAAHNSSEQSSEGHGCESGPCSWPESSHFVRVLVGGPGSKFEPVPLPWCDNATACPLHRWLDYTYGQVEGHMFYDVASNFRQKYAEARASEMGDSALETS